MILLDTHICVWWATDSPELRTQQRQLITDHAASGVGVSVISCWEVCKLVAKRRLILDLPVGEWVIAALALPGVKLVPFSTQIAIESNQLPMPIHGDPVDQILAASCRVLDCPLLTVDAKLRAYPHVRTLP